MGFLSAVREYRKEKKRRQEEKKTQEETQKKAREDAEAFAYAQQMARSAQDLRDLFKEIDARRTRGWKFRRRKPVFR